MGLHRSLAQFELFVMLAIQTLGDDAWSMQILEVIEEGSGRETSLGAVYSTVTRLEEKGLIDRQLGEPRPQRGGRARTYFRLTEEGRRELQETKTMLQRMLQHSSSDA